MEFKRKNIIGEEETIIGSAVEIMFMLQYLENSDQCYIFMDDGQLFYIDEKVEKGKDIYVDEDEEEDF